MTRHSLVIINNFLVTERHIIDELEKHSKSSKFEDKKNLCIFAIKYEFKFWRD